MTEPTDQPPPAEGALDLSAAMAAAQVRTAHDPPPQRWLISTADEADRRMRAYDLRSEREGVRSGCGTAWGVHKRHERGPMWVPGFGMIHPRLALLSDRAPPYAYALGTAHTYEADHQVERALTSRECDPHR